MWKWSALCSRGFEVHVGREGGGGQLCVMPEIRHRGSTGAQNIDCPGQI